MAVDNRFKIDPVNVNTGIAGLDSLINNVLNFQIKPKNASKINSGINTSGIFGPGVSDPSLQSAQDKLRGLSQKGKITLPKPEIVQEPIIGKKVNIKDLVPSTLSMRPDQSLEQNLVRSFPNKSNNLSGLDDINLSAESDPTLGDKLAGLDQSSTGEGANKKAELEARIEANKAIIADERRMQQGQLGQDQEETPKSKFEQNKESLQALFTTAMDEQKQLFGDLESDVGTKTIEDYKADFQKATGIDVSGEPDNKMALMSLGLSLMQNKAENRFLKKEDHLNQMEQKELTETIKLRAAQIKAGAKGNELAGKGFEVEPIDGQKQLTYRKALKKNATGRSVSVFTTFAGDIGRFKNADFNISRARARLGGLKEIVSKFVPSAGSGTIPIVKRVGDELKNYAVAFGIDPKSLFQNSKVVGIDKDGNIKKKSVNVSDTDLAQSIRDSLILEYKKFLTQETGNGISKIDVQALREAIGKIDILGNPAAAISRIEEIDGIFQKTQDQIGNVFTSFRDKDNYMTTEQYEKAMSILDGSEDNKVYKFGKSGKSFNVRVGKGGRMIYSLKTK